MATSPCLTRNTLKDYLNGSADDQRLMAIESHLAECEACEQTVLELERNPDTLLEGLRELNSGESQAKSDLAEQPSVVQRAVDAARELQAASMVPGHPLQKPGEIGAQQIGAYELLRPLGRGGMGLVMLARHSTLKKQVAIKILPSLIGDRPELVRRFQREIITAGQLSHPSIVHATDAGAEQGTHYLVMEYIDGLDLSRLARLNGPLSIADACELIRQTALGLSYAHAQGVVHRDIKPSNLMLDTAGRVKILDFGLAQLNLWEEAAVDLTTVGQLMGTLDYMAPEQAERVGPVDYRADLYALGATLFRLLTGRAPLAASPNMTLLEKVRLLGSQTAPLVSTLRDDCPSGLVRLIQQLLSRDPAARPASAAHIAEALLPFCVGHDVVSLLAHCRERATSAESREVSPLLPTVRTSPAPPTNPPRNNWIALAWLSPIAILAGIFITLETQKGQLVIESEVAGVKVNVLRDGKFYEQLQVKTGAESTRLFADKYSIEIDSASDELAIDQSSVEIRSRGTVVARITRKTEAAAPEQVAAPMSNPSLPNGGMKRYAPMYNGKTLEDWLEVLERELDAKTRGATLPAIIELGRAAEAPTRQRINRVLTTVINNSVGRVKWTSDGIRIRPSGHESVRSIINALIAINGEEAGFSLLSDHCMLTLGQVTPSTFVILSSLRRESQESFKIDELAWQWLVSNGRFQSLNAWLAWVAFTYIEDRLFWEDEEFARTLPTLIEKQPHLGLVALCELKIPGHLVRSSPFSDLDQEIAQRALRGFTAADSSPQIVAATAVRLAASKNFESFGHQLVTQLSVRLHELAEDRERLLAAVPRINAPVPANLAVTTNSERTDFRYSVSLANMPIEGAPTVAPQDQPVNSELASLLTLAIRLQAVFELAEPLAAAAKVVFEEARPVAIAGAAYFDLSRPPNSIRNNEIESKLNQLKWPYDQEQLRKLPKPFSEFSPAAWRAHRLAQTFVPLLTVQLPLFNTQLYTLIVDFYADVTIAARDKNGDMKVSRAEDASPVFMDWNGDGFATKDELTRSLREGMMRGYVTLRFGSFTRFLAGSDPPHFLTKDDQDVVANFTPAQFDEMDTDHDGRVTLEELVAYGMKHPKKDAPANASSTQTPTPQNPDIDSNNSAAERLMPTYEGNTLEHWLNVFRRDLDAKTRLGALPAILQLSKISDSETLARINHALTVAINSEATDATWSSNAASSRKPPKATTLQELIKYLALINGEESGFQVLKERCLTPQGKVTSATLILLQIAQSYDMGEQAGNWLLEDGRFDALDQTLAWYGLTLLEKSLAYRDADFCLALPKRIKNHPQLGLAAALTLWPPLGSGGRAELDAFEETVARMARDGFLADDSSPAVLALASARLAATKPIVETFRAELVQKLKERIGVLAKDRERLLADLAVGQPGVGLTQTVGIRAFELDSFDATTQKTRPAYSRYIGSEIACMLALARRLDAIRELDEPLSAVAEQIFEAALPFAGALARVEAEERLEPNYILHGAWPFAPKEISQLPKPLADFQPAALRAAKLAYTITSLPQATPLFRTRLLKLITDYWADIEITQFDVNGDGKLSGTEIESFRQVKRYVADSNRDGFATKDEIAGFFLEPLMAEFVSDWFGSAAKRKSTLTKAEALPRISEEMFAEIDTDGDGKLTWEEATNYRMDHLAPPSPKG